MIYEFRSYVLKVGSMGRVRGELREGTAHQGEAFEADGLLAHGDRAAEPDHSRLGL